MTTISRHFGNDLLKETSVSKTFNFRKHKFQARQENYKIYKINTATHQPWTQRWLQKYYCSLNQPTCCVSPLVTWDDITRTDKPDRTLLENIMWENRSNKRFNSINKLLMHWLIAMHSFLYGVSIIHYSKWWETKSHRMFYFSVLPMSQQTNHNKRI